MFEVLICRSEFKYLKKYANDRISSLPANGNDELSAVMARDPNGKLGFDVNQVAESILDELLGGCYCLRGSGSVDHPGVFPKGGMPNFFFKDKGGAFSSLVASHERYVLAMKKYSILSRYRHTEKPEPSELSHFLQDDSRIEEPLYESLLSSCAYFGISQRAQEHGWGAFYLISQDMDGFLTKLENLVGDEGRLVFIENMREMPCW